MNGLPVQLLKLLGGGGILSTAELARRLDVSESLVRLMTEDLVRRGYLAPLDSSCSSGCGTCSLAAACQATSAAKPAVLGLTPKGQHLATAA